MTVHGHIPTRSNKRFWTAYERRRLPNGGFDFDACSARHAPEVQPGIRDVEDLTLLSGLESVASESDTA